MNTLLFKSLVLAQQAGEAVAQATPDAANGGAAAGRPAQGSPFASLFASLWIFIPIFGLMYFLMIRPQQKKQKQVQEMLRQLKAGDKVMMNSGALGTISGVTEKTVKVTFADGHVIEFVRAAVAEILPAFPGEETPEKKDEKK